MIICLIVEGSYPYVTGGLSSWAQMLMTGMPEHQFIVYSVGAEEKNRGKFRYKLPENLLEVREVFLDSVLALNNPRMGRFYLHERERESLLALICGEGEINLQQFISTFRTGRTKNALDIFMSFDFFDVITMAYQQKFSHLPFTNFFWTVRSMLLPLVYLVQQELPQADVYHSAATGYAGIIGSLAAVLYNKPFIITEHGIYSREREEEIIKSSWVKADFKELWITYFYSLASVAYRHAGQVFTLFKNNAELQVFLGCDPDKVRVIPNGIDVEQYRDVGSALTKENEFVLGAVLRVVPIKDVLTMLRSFALVKQTIPHARLVIMGPTDEDQEYYEECLQTIQNLGLQDVQFIGTVDVRNHLGDLDLLVLSSISEGQPLVILEAMAAGKPCVTTDVGCCRELLYGNDDGLGQAGIVVPVMAFTDMAQAVIKLFKHPELRAQMGDVGYQRVSRHYTKRRFLASYQQVYTELRG